MVWRSFWASTPFTVPTVPTGMNIGVSMVPWGATKVPALALVAESAARIWKDIRDAISLLRGVYGLIVRWMCFCKSLDIVRICLGNRCDGRGEGAG